jgi:hypothetical protein
MPKALEARRSAALIPSTGCRGSAAIRTIACISAIKAAFVFIATGTARCALLRQWRPLLCFSFRLCAHHPMRDDGMNVRRQPSWCVVVE